MQNTYQVQSEGESLTARLVDENGQRRIELTYRNAIGDTQVGVYKNKLEVSTRAKLADGTNLREDSQGMTSLGGYLAAYAKLGPELRAQIPTDWHAVLGSWLAPKE